MSADGRLVAFRSLDDNLVPDDTNDGYDIFIRDLRRGTTRRLMLSDGSQFDRYAMSPSLSGSGRYLAFASESARLVAGDSNSNFDVFVRDRRRGTTRLVSRGFEGGPAEDGSSMPAISANGRFVAFSSIASNIVRRDTNGREDVFVYDRVARQTIWSSVSFSGGRTGSVSRWRTHTPVISASGRYVAFVSHAANAGVGDTNRRSDIFVHDLRESTTRRVSVASEGRETCLGRLAYPGAQCHGQPAISPDGRFVAFTSSAPELVPGDTNRTEDVFVHDTQTLVTTRVSVPAFGRELCPRGHESCATGPSISDGGRFIAFNSAASNIIAGDTNHVRDVFVRGPFG